MLLFHLDVGGFYGDTRVNLHVIELTKDKERKVEKATEMRH